MEKGRITPEEVKNLSRNDFIKGTRRLSRLYCVGDGRGFNLKDYPTNNFPDIKKEEKRAIKDLLKKSIKTLVRMQDMMYAQDRWSVLLIFQAMDAAGKDGAIKHVMSGLNPQGCEVTSFKSPSAEDLDHDYLWRCKKKLPERGRIGIFNRSYYEEVLVVRVHEKILKGQKIPEELVTENIWTERYTDICQFEDYLHRNGTIVLKFFLNLSRNEQKSRFLERIDNPDKNWKFSASDATERNYWDDYMMAYEQMIKFTSTEKSPWYVIPADDKPYARIAVAAAILDAMDSLDLAYPEVGKEKIAELREVKEILLAEK